jgi:OOP family OmpA-OmpF porin
VKSLSLATFLAGALAVAGLALAATWRSGPGLVAQMAADAERARDAAGGKGITADFTLGNGWLTRHPLLSGGEDLPDAVRARAAAAIAAVPGVGGVSWRTVRPREANKGGEQPVANVAMHCQQDVEAVLEARSIRFAEASAQIDAASEAVLDEVAAALRPCLGGIIAVTGHTDSNGDETANRALSRARADAVRWALIGRGIPADGLRSEGVGSDRPLEGLTREDPANRRIEFSVIEKAPLAPRPIDTPGPG